MKKFASSRSLNKILAQCDSSSREYEEIQAVERKWHLHLATPRCLLLDRRSKASLFFAAPPPPKRAPSTTLTLRSKSMTAELEELEKLDEILAAAAEPTLRPDIADADSRAATVKQRPTSRRITPAEISSLFERQGLPGPEKLPGSLRKGIPRTKSVGMAGLGAARGRKEWDTVPKETLEASLHDPLLPTQIATPIHRAPRPVSVPPSCPLVPPSCTFHRHQHPCPWVFYPHSGCSLCRVNICQVSNPRLTFP
uniref:SH3 and multiple ankyrin repeat domains protein 3-like n=1 Tax=Ursus maritimus TaxID=29073 RepID=A0A452UR66_URSMA